ncbi:MAG TPA: carbonic anhydrase family protein [Candidatus Ligilactobacillus excrementavium]|nr:carbonic anhydrase family protein [Candidatus Ligilactobacillus excrementavium]
MEYLDYALQNSWESLSNLESPIDIDLTLATNKSLDKQPLALTFASNKQIKKKIQANGDQFLASGTLTIADDKYELQRIHFHDGSEHTLQGRRLDGEIHFVYQNENGANLVLALLCQVNDQQAKHLPLNQIYTEDAQVNELSKLLPDDLSHVTYTGSLTTPPLKADVTWIVLTTPHYISTSSKKALHNDYPENHREIQPLNGREVTYYKK